MYLCIDIGGTKTIVALVDANGKILHSVKFATLQNQRQFYENLRQQIRVNFCISSIKSCAVAMPGIVKRNVATWLGNLDWHNFDIATKLHDDFGLTVYVENDANLAALAEAHHCKGRSLYFTFSTGIGGGIVEDGQLAKRYRDFEPGHVLYTYEGVEKEWEDFAAASAINAKYGKLVDEITEPEDWLDITHRMLLGLVPMTTSIKPDRIIFGGPLGLALDTYRTSLRKQLRAKLPAKIKMPRLVVAKYGSFSVIYGCYRYAKLKESHR